MSETRKQAEQAWTVLEAIVGREHLRRAGPADAIDGVQPAGVIAPGSAEEVAQVLRHCSSAGLAVAPRGGGTKLGLGNRPQALDFLLSTERLNRILEHAFGDMTVTVEAGCTIRNLQQAVQQHGQRLAADPLRPEQSTVGGLLATAHSGTLRIRYGAVRDLVLGLEMALPDGSVIKAGGKVVKNVAGYDLCKLAIGSLGTLGVITRVVFRLHPVPVGVATYSSSPCTAAEARKLVLAILDSKLTYTGLQFRAQRPDQATVDVRFEGIPESLKDQALKLSRVASGHAFAEQPDRVWSARQELFGSADSSVICKICVLPAQMGSLCEAIFRQSQAAQVTATLVAQGTGVAEVRLDTNDRKAQATALTALRGEVERLEGTLVVQQCPLAIKEGLDIWGAVAGTLPLMRQVKAKFDPAHIMNPGRFVGAI